MKLASMAIFLAAMAFAQRSAGHSHGGVAFTGGRGRYIAPPPVAHPAHAPGVVIVPYPVYYTGGYYGYDSSVPMASQSAPAYDASQAGYANGEQPPVVVINQGFVPDVASPSLQNYSDTPLPGPDGYRAPPPRDPPATIYLIAMTDHSIVAAIGYWVKGDTLNYITQDGNQNSVSMSLIDRDFSKQLNDERHVEFHLPAQ